MYAIAAKRKDSGMDNIVNDKMNVRKIHIVENKGSALTQRYAFIALVTTGVPKNLWVVS